MCLQPIRIAANHCVTLWLTWLTFSLLFVKHCHFHSLVRQILNIQVGISFCVPKANSFLKYKKSH